MLSCFAVSDLHVMEKGRGAWKRAAAWNCLRTGSILFDERRRTGFLNTASVGNTVLDGRNTSGSQGLYVEVHPDCIWVRGVDYLTGMYIAGCDARLEL